jgi:hypothetical protein
MTLGARSYPGATEHPTDINMPKESLVCQHWLAPCSLDLLIASPALDPHDNVALHFFHNACQAPLYPYVQNAGTYRIKW